MRVFDETAARAHLLDAKADSMMRYVAPGTGLVSIAALLFSTGRDSNPISTFLTIVGILFLLLAASFALFASRPNFQLIPPGVINALTIADDNRTETEEMALADFALGVQLSTIGAIRTTDDKGKMLRKSHTCYLIGISLVFSALTYSCLRAL